MFYILIVYADEMVDRYHNVKRRLDRYFQGYPEDVRVIRGRIKNDDLKTEGEIVLVEEGETTLDELKEDLEKKCFDYIIAEGKVELDDL